MEWMWVFCTSPPTPCFTVERALLWATGPLHSSCISATKQWVSKSLRVSHSVFCEVDSKKVFVGIGVCLQGNIITQNNYYHQWHSVILLGSLISIRIWKTGYLLVLAPLQAAVVPTLWGRSPTGMPRSLGEWVVEYCSAEIREPEFPHLVCGGLWSSSHGWLLSGILDQSEAWDKSLA